jgi:hypothetical protein
MAYLSQPTTKTDFGVVTVGDYIDVIEGVISLKQDLAPTSSVTFKDVTVQGELFLNSKSVINSVVASSGSGISLTDTDFSGPDIAFTINNTGVLSLTAGTGISLSGSTGTITVSATGTSVINTVLVTSGTYNVLPIDQYIGVDSTTQVNIVLPTGVAGRTFTIKSEHGSGGGKISITGTGGEKIDNASTYNITTALQSITVVFRGSQWHVI